MNLFLGFEIIFLCLGLFLAALLVICFKLWKRNTFLEKKELKIEAERNKKMLEVIQKAGQDYLVIITNANKKAKEIVRNALSIKKSSEKDLEKTLEEFEKEQEALIQKTSEDLFEKYNIKVDDNQDIKVSSNISKDIETYSDIQISEYKEIIEKETLESQKIIEQKTADEYQKIEEELNTFKKEKMKNIEENLHRIIKEVTEAAIGKSLNLEDKEDLIKKALEEAKKSGKFNE